MPKPIDRFLHTYDFKLAKGMTYAGGTTIAASVALYAGALAAASGTALAAQALVAAQVALIAGTGGVALAVLPAVYGLAKATFWRKNRQEIAEKKKPLSDDDFNNPMDWDCYWITIVVIGYERTGKTQLKKRLQGNTKLRGASSESTPELEIHLSLLDSEKKVYIALLDSRGAKFDRSPLQDRLIDLAVKKAQFIILVLDHADTERHGRDADLETQRLKVQEDFIKNSVINKIKRRDSSKSPLQGIMVVMNKADVWGKKTSKDHIHKWTQEQADKLRNELSCTVQIYYLSAEDLDHSVFYQFKNDLVTYAANYAGQNQ
jgi:hypothetical protein